MGGREHSNGQKQPTQRPVDRLRDGRVLVVGVGGLGCPAAWSLARAGVGTIGLIDPDEVELSNLHRQVLHSDGDLGRAKVESAADKLRWLHPQVQIRTFHERLTDANLASVFVQFDFVIDGTDSTAAKYLINDGAILTETPYSHAGILGFRGQTMTVVPGVSTCVRCLFPTPPEDGEVPTCQEAGVVGVVAAALGVVQAGEAIKYFLGTGELLTDRLLTFDALTASWRSIALRRNTQCPVCGDYPIISALAPTANAA